MAGRSAPGGAGAGLFGPGRLSKAGCGGSAEP
eukprot:CAMPEP_0204308146 /NCGR_PEP_ID=MMETSP0469-20131031/335_1 /ASSEMBLY_ACC=CAM_ASM_000384 /TAXON_ID=2969 /ORGANISM="Oxyrrhis marina" /LENGTH=31 /DNA_ID= /DNA_START= /DNA_END= /DNA_ORIENTATION=